jgi:peptidoglycan/xylan/chitin deacetylase (PgdA/CDA1 family)
MTEQPAEHAVSVVINVMLEQWEPGTAPGLGPMGNPLPGGAIDHQALSWARYGPRTGTGKLLDLLGARSVPATFYVSGVLAEDNPKLVATIAGDGHEIAAHGWAQNIVPATLDKPTERAQLRRCLTALTDATGQAPAGWISPRCTPSADTAELLAEAGLLWFGDVFDADDPYLIETGKGSIVGLPFGMEVNDLPMMVRYGEPARELLDTFDSVLDAALAEGQPTHIDVTVHAHVAARPVGRRQLALILDRVAQENIPVRTRRQLAERFLSSGTDNDE